MQTEICDFLAISTMNSTCIFIHCKHGKNKLSASDFQDVCGQVVKNLKYLINTNFNELSHWDIHSKRWEESWRNTPRGFLKQWNVDRLVIKPQGKNVSDFTELFKSIISSPLGKKEVWIVQGGLSKKQLKQQLLLQATEQKEQISQIMWILENTKYSLSSIGVELKVFCQE